MPTGQELREQGRQEELLERYQEGLQEGRLEGRTEMLLFVLYLRFGDAVDREIERRVEAASAVQIYLWARRVLSAATLAELLAGRSVS